MLISFSDLDTEDMISVDGNLVRQICKVHSATRLQNLVDDNPTIENKSKIDNNVSVLLWFEKKYQTLR